MILRASNSWRKSFPRRFFELIRKIEMDSSDNIAFFGSNAMSCGKCVSFNVMPSFLKAGFCDVVPWGLKNYGVKKKGGRTGGIFGFPK